MLLVFLACSCWLPLWANIPGGPIQATTAAPGGDVSGEVVNSRGNRSQCASFGYDVEFGTGNQLAAAEYGYDVDYQQAMAAIQSLRRVSVCSPREATLWESPAEASVSGSRVWGPVPLVAASGEFTGKERDAETGLDYFGARYYGGAQGRFTSPDYTADGSDPVPIPGADLDNPQSLNLYSYVRNNPTVNIDEDGHDCVVQTRNSETKETVFVTSGNCDKISVGDGQSKTYIGGTVDVGSVQSNGSGGISLSYTPYSGGAGVADLQSAPVPDRPGLAYGWGNNAQGYQQIAAAGKFIERTTLVYAAVFGSVGAAVAGGEIAAATAASRSGIIFRLAHGMRVAAGHSQVLAQQAAIKNAIAAAIASGAVQKIAGGGFQGIVNVAGTYIRFTGAFTPNGVVVSNVMGAALQR